jgi:hypothetical protein
LSRRYGELDTALLDHRQQFRIAEFGNIATEPLLGRALRPGHDGAQPALDLVAADRDLFDMALPQEGLELRIADLDRALARRFSGNKDEHGQRKHRDGERDRPEASEVFLGRLVPHDADLILLHPSPFDQYQRGGHRPQRRRRWRTPGWQVPDVFTLVPMGKSSSELDIATLTQIN